MKALNTLMKPLQEDMAMSRSLAGEIFSSPTSLPVSFTYDNAHYYGIPAEWKPKMEKRVSAKKLAETIFTGRDEKTGLTVRVECFEYPDYPVVEWIAWFTNEGKDPTPVLSDVLSMDGGFKGASPVLYHCNGDFWQAEGYTPGETAIKNGDTLSFAPVGGRPCDSAFPYYRIMFEGCGLTMAIGWPAQWSASFAGTGSGVHVKAGQEKTHLRLMPGESIRTPRMTVMSWTGNAERAANLWRRWYRAYIMPEMGGRPLQPKLAACYNEGGNEFVDVTGESQIRSIDRCRSLGFDFDIWWIDAGWYTCWGEKSPKNWWTWGVENPNPEDKYERHWWFTGTWEPDPDRFPKGLGPVAEHASKNGMDFLLWLEPERVTRDSKLDREHQEWLLKVSDNEEERTRLLNLGNPDCRRWLTEHVCKLIRDNGIRIYRQDFNFPPLQFWRDNEAEDRQGMNENLHVQGYLQYWDDLLSRNPGLLIDSCSAGGRRNDLETMRRSVPLHYSDFGYGNNPVKLAFHHTLYSWLPYFKDCTLCDDEGFKDIIDSFSYHCGMAPMLFPAIDIRRDDYDYDLCLRLVGIWRRAADFIVNGDYYPHTPFDRSTGKWVVWQFDDPEAGKGFIQGIRHSECVEESIKIYPKGLCMTAKYLMENPETGETFEIDGSKLAEDGFELTLPKRSASIWFYCMRQNEAEASAN